MTGRLMVMTLIASLGGGSAALAGETLLESGSRIVVRTVQGQAPSGDTLAATNSRALVSIPARPLADRINPPLDRPSLTQEGNAISQSGMKRRTKLMIFLATGVGFATSAYMIDRNVVDITPSTLGQRRD